MVGEFVEAGVVTGRVQPRRQASGSSSAMVARMRMAGWYSGGDASSRENVGWVWWASGLLAGEGSLVGSTAEVDGYDVFAEPYL